MERRRFRKRWVLAAATLLLLVAVAAYNWELIQHPRLILASLVGWRNELIQDGPLTYWWGDLVRTVEVVGDTAYVGLGTRLGVVDVHDPHNTKLLQAVDLQGIVHGFARRNHILYCAQGAGGLSIFDISDAQHPVKLSHIVFPGYGMHVALLGEHFILFANESGGWEVFDVRDPRHIIPVRHVDGGWISAIRVYGNIAYVLDGYAGVAIYDVSRPEEPRHLKTVPIELPGEVFEIDPPPIWLEVQDGYAYVSNGSDGMRVLDVRNPAKAKVVAHLPLDSFSYTVAVRGNRAYMANLTLGLVVIDISNPRKPKRLSNLPTPGNAYDIIFRGERGYVSDGANGFMILDISDPDRPRETGYYQVQKRTRGVTLNGDRLVTADVGHGIRVFDVSHRQSPVLLGSVETPGLARKAAIAGDMIYVVDVLGGFQKIDASNPRQPRVARTFGLEEHPWGIATDGQLVYCAMGSHGFSIYDIQQDPPPLVTNIHERSGQGSVEAVRPAQPGETMGNVPMRARAAGAGYTIDCAKTDGLAMTGDVLLGLTIYDVSDPPHAAALGRYAISLWNPINLFRRGGVTTVPGVFAEGKTAYLAGYDRGLEIIDLQQPAKPTRQGHLAVPGHSYGVWKDGNDVCLSTYEGDLLLVDVTDRTAPREKKRFHFDGQLTDVVCDRGTAYVAAGTEGLLVVNLDNGEPTTFPVQ